MLTVKKNYGIEGYLQEGLLALVPLYEDGFKTAVLTRKGRHLEKRSVNWLVGKIAAHFSIDMIRLRRHCGALLQVKHHIALAITEKLVLLPVKTHQASGPGETTVGYVSMLEIGGMVPGDEADSPVRGTILFRESDQRLETCYTLETLQLRLRQGELVRCDCMARKRQGESHAGLSRQDLIDLLPNCDCVLRELFISRYGLS